MTDTEVQNPNAQAGAGAPDPNATSQDNQNVNLDPNANQEQNSNTGAGDTTTNSNVDYQKLLQAIEDVKKNFTSQGSPQNNQEAVEKYYSALEEKTNLNRATLEWLHGFVTSTAANTQVTISAAEQEGKSVAKSILGSGNEAYMAEVEAMMANQPLDYKQNKKVWENAAYVVKGKNADKFSVKNNGNNTTIIGGNVNGLNRPNGQNNNGTPSAKQYSDAEKFFIQKNHNGDTKEYEKFKNAKSLSQLGYSQEQAPIKPPNK